MIFKRFNRNGEATYWLGTRHHYYDTDYEYNHKIDWDVAKYLVLEVGISDFMNCVRDELKKEKTVTCKVCGCIKTIEELKQDHKSCIQE